jgi:hypothetical protein
LSFTYIYTTEVKYPGNLNCMSFKLLVRFYLQKPDDLGTWGFFWPSDQSYNQILQNMRRLNCFL